MLDQDTGRLCFNGIFYEATIKKRSNWITANGLTCQQCVRMGLGSETAMIQPLAALKTQSDRVQAASR